MTPWTAAYQAPPSVGFSRQEYWSGVPYNQPRQHIKKQRHYFTNKSPSSQSYGFPRVMYRYESWTIKKAECQRIDAFELWCWRRLLRVPWTARRSNQSILKEITEQTAAAAAAESLRRVRLCDPIDGSPPGSPVPGILQARTLEWVAISFSNA